jgi:hypothetical protein
MCRLGLQMMLQACQIKLKNLMQNFTLQFMVASVLGIQDCLDSIINS